MPNIAKKIAAFFLVSALIWTAPGLGCYEALAQVVGRVNMGGGAASLPALGTAEMPAGEPSAGISLLSPAASLDVPGSVLPTSAGILPAAAAAAQIPAGARAETPLAAAPAIEGPAVNEARASHSDIPDGREAPVLSGKRDLSPGGDQASAETLGWLSAVGRAALPSGQLEALPLSGAHQAGMDLEGRMTGARFFAHEDSLPGPAAGAEGASGGGNSSGLAPARGDRGSDIPGEPPSASNGRGEGGRGSRWIGILRALVTPASAAAVVAVHFALAAAWPAVFGLAPVAAVWAVVPAVFVLPAALWARHARMASVDSPRLAGVKLAMDVFIGAILGGMAIAGWGWSPALLSDLGRLGPMALAASSGLAVGAGAKAFGGAGGSFDAILAWISATILPALIGVVAVGLISPGSVLAMMALPAAMTMVFFLGRIIRSAVNGTPFSVPGTLQQIRFPTYPWVMTGVVLALLTGYPAVWTSAVFAFWTFFGKTQFISDAFLSILESPLVMGSRAAGFFRIPAVRWVKDNLFTLAFLGLLTWSAFHGFAVPVAGIVLWFAPERAAMWTESLLARLLPRTSKAPVAAPEEPHEAVARHWPRINLWVRTGVLMASLFALGFGLSALVFGWGEFLKNLAISGAFGFLSLFLSKTIIKLVMGAKTTTPQQDPEVFEVLGRVLGRINEGRPEKDKLATWEVVNASMGGPNAAATGISPRRAMVLVTEEIKKLLLDPPTLRRSLIRLFGAKWDAEGKALALYGRAVRAHFKGIPETAGPEAYAAALEAVDPSRPEEAQRLKELGKDILEGVLAHEAGHVMHRDPLQTMAAGTVQSALGSAASAAIWALGRIKAFLGAPFGRMKDEKARPEAVAPAVGIVGLLGAAAAVWAPVLAQTFQLAISRTREAHADDFGGRLTGKPWNLALGLGLLMTWRPEPGFRISPQDLPRIASQAHIMTVNPIAQLGAAGVLPGYPQAERGPSPSDDAFFNLFIDHPDTLKRIVGEMYDLMKEIDGKAASAAPPTMAPRDPGPAGLLAKGEDAGKTLPRESFESFTAPGVDDQMLPVIQTLKDVIEKDAGKSRQLGHLLDTLQEFVDRKGTLRYAYPKGRDAQGRQIDVASAYEPWVNSVYIHHRYLHANPMLVAGLLAARLQQVHDDFNGRSPNTTEGVVRQLRAMDVFLSGMDMTQMARTLNINNVWEVLLFEALMDERSDVALGWSHQAGQYDPGSAANRKLEAERAVLEQEERSLGRMEDRLRLLEKVEDPNGRRTALASRIEKLKGNILIRQARIATYQRDGVRQFSGHPLETPLAAGPAGKGQLNLGKLKLIPMEKGPAVDDAMAESISFIKKVLAAAPAGSPVRQLAFLVEGPDSALGRLKRAGGRLFVNFQTSGALAFFDPILLNTVVGWPFARLHPVLLAAIVLHELGHVGDFFGVPLPGETDGSPRPLTRETEYLAFRWWAIWGNHLLGANMVSEFLDPKSGYDRDYNEKVYNLIFHAVNAYLDGQNSLEAMVSASYTEFFGAHFNGLRTAKQLEQDLLTNKLLPQRKRHEDWTMDARAVQVAVDAGDVSRQGQLEAYRRVLALSAAKIELFQRQIDQLRRTMERNDAAAPPPAARPEGSGAV